MDPGAFAIVSPLSLYTPPMRGGNHSSATPDPEARAVPLEELPRLSTETQRRNGFRQSNAPDRSARIIEDISNGNYPCSICTDNITQDDGQEYTMWQCRDCFNIFHFRCIRNWSQSGERLFDGLRAYVEWRCPCCLTVRDVAPIASCWCGKESLNFHDRESRAINSCIGTCNNTGKCRHDGDLQICDKPCHPGPCGWPCTDRCVDAVEVPRLRNSRTRIQERERLQMKDDLTKAALFFAGICIFYAFGAILLVYHNKWHTQPYKYPNFYIHISEEELALVLGYIFIAVFVLLFLVIRCFGHLALMFHSLWNLDETPRTTRKSLMRVFGRGLFLLLGIGFVVIPIVGFAAGPDIAWYHQMRNSCSGYDIRVEMDNVESSGDKLTREPSHVFNIHNLISPQIKNHKFHLASRLQPVIHSTQPFQYYERFSGSSSQTQHIAVDVDTKKGRWRMLQLSGPDLENAWMANDYKRNKTLPEFSNISEKVIKNGTFTGISSNNPHMNIPELDLVISNMHPFLYGCRQQPFLRVFNVANKARGEGTKMASKEWSNKYDENIVMRTASFGHGNQRLDMCAKEGSALDRSGEQNVEGMHDDLLVPMALISAVRKRVHEMDDGPQCR